MPQQSSERLVLECQVIVLAYERDRTQEQLRRLYAQHLQLRQYCQPPARAATSPHPFDGFRRDLLAQFLEVLDEHLALAEEVSALKQRLCCLTTRKTVPPPPEQRSNE